MGLLQGWSVHGNLVLLAHAGPHRRGPFQAAAARLGLEVDVDTVFEQGLSSAYERAARRAAARNNGVILPALTERNLDDYERIFLGCFSAGYGLAKLLDPISIGMLSGLVLLDSGYADLDPDRSASDTGIYWLVQWALAARHGEKTLWIAHTLNDPGSYASTGKVAAEAMRLSGGVLHDEEPPLGCRRRRRDGRFVVEEWPTSHGAAIADWGPDAMARAIHSSISSVEGTNWT